MDESVIIVTLLEIYGSGTPSGGNVYIGGKIMSFFVDAKIAYDEFMQMLYSSWGINPMDYTITAKAIFNWCAQMLGLPQKAAKINTENSFCAFVNVNDSRYVSTMSHCHLYLIVEPIGGAEHSMAEYSRPVVPEHTRTCGMTVTSFKSSSESNLLSEPMPAKMTQFQYTNQVIYIVPQVFHPSCSAPHFVPWPRMM
ncbi:hypothetical protein OWV82_013381 [Melia azedarach]|uniref:Uncharacterized protein n=1 Tax=Melia azedarach TaxID=155640 RepID=A0ACC1XW75_MELAZ|nr:hypothetical protein OWV82_013381 [Melia azedarach]